MPFWTLNGVACGSWPSHRVREGAPRDSRPKQVPSATSHTGLCLPQVAHFLRPLPSPSICSQVNGVGPRPLCHLLGAVLIPWVLRQRNMRMKRKGMETPWTAMSSASLMPLA